MKVEQREKNGVIILDIQGEIDLYNAPEIKEVMQRCIDAKQFKIVVNLEKVSYIDSSGIGALISGFSTLKKYEGGLKLVNVYASVKKVFELTKLTSFFEIYESEDEAITNFA
ncbi:MAG: STAS domain-containing protein [Spirochaetia bacterium]|nr:STAS domain-containing protein [Spirochaetia bacterium]